MWLHIDSSNYGEAEVGVATSSSICGSYSYIGSWRPLGYESRDMGLFQDTDGQGYLLTEDVCIYSLSQVQELHSSWFDGFFVSAS
jgi:hypothetical protein